MSVKLDAVLSEKIRAGALYVDEFSGKSYIFAAQIRNSDADAVACVCSNCGQELRLINWKCFSCGYELIMGLFMPRIEQWNGLNQEERKILIRDGFAKTRNDIGKRGDWRGDSDIPLNRYRGCNDPTIAIGKNIFA